MNKFIIHSIHNYININKNNMQRMPFIVFIYINILIITSVTYTFASSYEVIENICSTVMTKKNYRDTVKEFSYRMQDAVEVYGCDAIPVYYAFGNDENDSILYAVENSRDLMESMIALMRSNPEIADEIHHNSKLVQALSQYLNDPDKLYNYISFLQSCSPQQSEVIASQEKNPEIFIARMMIPGLSSLKLQKTFSPRELPLFITLLNASCIGSDEEYLPALADLPNDSCDVYKMIIQEWGIGEMQEFLKITPYAVSSIRPPMTWREISHLFPVGSYPEPERFREMQRRYIHVQHMLYQEANRRYSPAWGATICTAFADALAQSLMNADFQQEENIKRFLSWLISDSLFFQDIVIPSYCGEPDNISLFCLMLGTTEKNYLGGLADWYVKGNLARLLNNWAKTTSPEKFAGIYSTASGSPSDDATYLSTIMELSRKRLSLPPQQQSLLDHLLTTLPAPEEPAWLAPSFLLSIGDTFFAIMQQKNFSHPHEVATRLLQFGYPTSESPSLYEYFCLGNPPQSPNADMALRTRGSLPEDELLRSGTTLRGKIRNISGADPMVATIIALDTIDIACTICSFAFPPARAGSVVTKFGVTVLRSATKSTITKAGKRLVLRRAFTTGARRLSKTIEKVSKQERTTDALKKGPRTSSEVDLLETVINITDLWNNMKTLFDVDPRTYIPDLNKVQYICPGKQNTFSTTEEHCS